MDDFAYYAQVGTTKTNQFFTRLDPSVSGINRSVAKGTRTTVSGRSGSYSVVNVHVGPSVFRVRTNSTGTWSYSFVVTRTVDVWGNRNEHAIHTPGIIITAR